MLVYHRIDVTCPICGRRISGREVGGLDARGQESDLFLVPADGEHPVALAVHTCHGCGFSGGLDDFQRDFSPRILDRLSRHHPFEMSPPIQRGSERFPHIRYELAERTLRAIGGSALDRGILLLKASWCLRIPPGSTLFPSDRRALERTYRMRAIHLFRSALTRCRGDANRRSLLTYLVGELYRRERYFGSAERHLRVFLSTSAEDHPLRPAAHRLIDLARSAYSEGVLIEVAE